MYIRCNNHAFQTNTAAREVMQLVFLVYGDLLVALGQEVGLVQTIVSFCHYLVGVVTVKCIHLPPEEDDI